MATPWKSIVDWPNGVSTLNANITNATETIVLASDPGSTMSTSNFYIRIGFEQILVASRTTVTLTCTGGRGANGTTAAAHFAGDTVEQDFFAANVTAMRTAINAVEDKTQKMSSAGEFSTPLNTLQIYGGATISLKLGSDSTGNTLTDATAKVFRLAVPNYTNANLPVIAMTCNSGATTSTMNYGGGTSVGYAVTDMAFYTAANNTTATGTSRLQIDSAGVVSVMNRMNTVGGLHVGGSSDPGTDNLIVDGTSTLTGLVTATAGVAAGASGTTRGILKAFRGSSTNTPGYLYLESCNGTAYYIYAEDDGTLKIHNAAPTANTDGNVVGAQT